MYKKLLASATLLFINFYCFAQRRSSPRSFEALGFPQGKEVTSSLQIGLPLLIGGFLIAYIFVWSKKDKSNGNGASGNIGCLGMIIMAVGLFFLIPLLVWIEFIFASAIGLGFSIIIIGAVIYGLYCWLIKKPAIASGNKEPDKSKAESVNRERGLQKKERLPEYQARSERIDADVFDNLRTIPVGSAVILSPISFDLIDEETSHYSFITNNESVKKFLPSVYVKNKEEANARLMKFAQDIALKSCILYCIKVKQHQSSVGYIKINTPLTPTGLNSWTLEYWLAEQLQGAGLMAASIYQLLIYLKEFGVPEVKALVHHDNIKSIRVLEKVGFRHDSQELGGQKRMLYKIRMN